MTGFCLVKKRFFLLSVKYLCHAFDIAAVGSLVFSVTCFGLVYVQINIKRLTLEAPPFTLRLKRPA